MQVCTSLQTDNHASTAPLSFLQAAAQPSVKALKAQQTDCKSKQNVCNVLQAKMSHIIIYV